MKYLSCIEQFFNISACYNPIPNECTAYDKYMSSAHQEKVDVSVSCDLCVYSLIISVFLFDGYCVVKFTICLSNCTVVLTATGSFRSVLQYDFLLDLVLSQQNSTSVDV